MASLFIAGCCMNFPAGGQTSPVMSSSRNLRAMNVFFSILADN